MESHFKREAENLKSDNIMNYALGAFVHSTKGKRKREGILIFRGTNQRNIIQILRHESIHQALFHLGLKKECLALDFFVPVTLVMPFGLILDSWIDEPSENAVTLREALKRPKKPWKVRFDNKQAFQEFFENCILL